MIITAYYEAKTYFVIPKAIKKFLIPEALNIPAMAGKPGSWWIKWDVLYYIDKEGNEQKLEGSQDEGERKRPIHLQVEDDV
jgi:hypothetical protein